MKKRKALILTASIGSGHDQAAETIAAKLKSMDGKIEIRMFDFMSILNPSISLLIKNSYLKMLDVAPNWYNLLYHQAMKMNTQGKVKNILVYRYEKKLLGLINQEKPDTIIFTNPFPSLVVSGLKKKGKVNINTATIITDYNAHRVWLNDTVDDYFVGCDDLKLNLISMGIKANRIAVTGIPIHDKFFLPLDKSTIIQELKLDSNIPIILVMGGGLGLGPIDEIISHLDQINRPLQVLVVAGKNKELLRALEQKKNKYHHPIKLFGYCENVHELMEISSLLVSKAGGITMTEAIQKELPALITQPIPGQEVANAEYLSYIGTAKYMHNLRELTATVENLLFNCPQEYLKMKEQCQIHKKADASAIIARNVLKAIEHQYRHTPMIQ